MNGEPGFESDTRCLEISTAAGMLYQLRPLIGEPSSFDDLE